MTIHILVSHMQYQFTLLAPFPPSPENFQLHCPLYFLLISLLRGGCLHPHAAPGPSCNTLVAAALLLLQRLACGLANRPRGQNRGHSANTCRKNLSDGWRSGGQQLTLRGSRVQPAATGR